MKDKIEIKKGNYSTVYYKNGLIHRDNDLPAIEHKDGCKEWYINGKRHRDNDLPAIEWENGNKKWYKNGLIHRDNDLPAIERVYGEKEWYKNGLRHRDNNKPAIERINGDKEWFENGIELTKEKFIENNPTEYDIKEWNKNHFFEHEKINITEKNNTNTRE